MSLETFYYKKGETPRERIHLGRTKRLNREYVYTSLVSEIADTNVSSENKNIEHTQVNLCGFDIQRLKIKGDNQLNEYNLEAGEYSTLYFKRISELETEELENLSRALSKELIRFLPTECNNIFVAGLGNRYLTSDTIGPKCVEKLEITRHVSIYNEEIFNKMDVLKISALSPGVMAQTGIETAEIIKGAVSAVSPDAVIVIDSLCARSPDRLASTLQISSSGISPGSGVGNTRMKINSESLSCPVIMLGVPTVVSSSTLIYDALEKAEIENIPPQLEEILRNGRSYFVTVNEIDELTDKLSDIISDAVFFVSKKQNAEIKNNN